jgi:predicted NBD/HSP70 family sugar kinase
VAAKLSRTEIVIDNDANMAALGEATLGAGKGRNPVYYVTLGSGVGGGLVVNGRVYHGAAPGEAEIGTCVWIAMARSWSSAARVGRWIARFANAPRALCAK